MATYPGAIVSFATHNTGDTIQGADVNTPNAEIVAVETGLLNGIQHNLNPDGDATRQLGNNTHRWISPNGTAALPGINFAGDQTTGFAFSSGIIAAVGGVQIGLFEAAGFQVTALTFDGSTFINNYTNTTWTPTDASGASLALTIQVSDFIRIGNLVWISAQIVYPATADTHAAAIGGLPFTSAQQTSFPLAMHGGGGTFLMGQVNGAAKTISLLTQVAGATVQNASLSGGTVRFQGIYRV